MIVEQFECTYIEMGIPNDTIGIKLANSDNTEQAEFFNAFAKEMKSWECLDVNIQLSSIAEELTEEAKDILVKLVSYF